MQKLQIVLCSVPRARAGVKVHLKLSMCCALFRHTNRKGDEFLARAKNFVVVITICCGCASRLSYEPLFISPFLLSLSVLSLSPAFPLCVSNKSLATKRVAASATVRVEQAAVYLCVCVAVCVGVSMCVWVCQCAYSLKCGISSAGIPCVLRCPLVSAAISVSARLVTAFCG